MGAVQVGAIPVTRVSFGERRVGRFELLLCIFLGLRNTCGNRNGPSRAAAPSVKQIVLATKINEIDAVWAKLLATDPWDIY